MFPVRQPAARRNGSEEHAQETHSLCDSWPSEAVPQRTTGDTPRQARKSQSIRSSSATVRRSVPKASRSTVTIVVSMIENATRNPNNPAASHMSTRALCEFERSEGPDSMPNQIESSMIFMA